MPTPRIFNRYVCAQCNYPLSSLKKAIYHRTKYNHQVNEIEEAEVDYDLDVEMQSDLNDTDMEDLVDELPSVESLPYYSFFDFDPSHGQTRVYNLHTNTSFDETELNSIQFREIIDAYSIPREASRELVYLFRTILKNNLEGATFKN
ncbi:hypothetical protein ABG067_007898, partial [Albugo candida]